MRKLNLHIGNISRHCFSQPDSFYVCFHVFYRLSATQYVIKAPNSMSGPPPPKNQHAKGLLPLRWSESEYLHTFFPSYIAPFSPRRRLSGELELSSTAQDSSQVSMAEWCNERCALDGNQIYTERPTSVNAIHFLGFLDVYRHLQRGLPQSPLSFDDQVGQSPLFHLPSQQNQEIPGSRKSLTTSSVAIDNSTILSSRILSRASLRTQIPRLASTHSSHPNTGSGPSKLQYARTRRRSS